MAKGIIDTEFISIIHAKENIIYSAAMLVQDENGKEIYAESWYLNYDLTKFKPHTYKFGLKLANTPKYRPARGEVKIKYSNKKQKGTNLTSLQLKIRKLQKKFNICYWFCKGPTQTDLLLIDKCKNPKICYKIEENENCTKYEGVHHPLEEIRHYAKFLYDPNTQEYTVKGDKIFLRRKKSKQSKKDAYKNNLHTKNFKILKYK